MKKGQATKGQKKDNQGAYPCAMRIGNKRVWQKILEDLFIGKD